MDSGTPQRFYGGVARYRTKNISQPSWNSRLDRGSISQVPQHAYGPGDVLEVYEGGSTPESPFGHASMSGSSSDEGGDLMKEMVAMMKEQSNRMDEFLQVQKEIKAEQDLLRKEFENFKKDGNDAVPRKKMVSRVLTERVNTLHETMPTKMKPSESSTSAHNKTVMASLVREIESDPENTFPRKIVTLAVKRKYEYERRTLKEAESGDSLKLSRIKKAKYDQRKLRSYNRRKSVVTEKEKQYFDQLSKEYMSDESDSSDSESIVIHKLSWRSLKLNDWMEELDKRYKKKLERNSSKTPSKKRVDGLPSSSVPPSDAPKWAVDESWTPPNAESSDAEPNDETSEFQDFIFD